MASAVSVRVLPDTNRSTAVHCWGVKRPSVRGAVAVCCFAFAHRLPLHSRPIHLDFAEASQLPLKVEVSANGLTLFTEAGYLLLVKPMRDKLSWQVQEMMIRGIYKSLLTPPPYTEKSKISPPCPRTFRTPPAAPQPRAPPPQDADSPLAQVSLLAHACQQRLGIVQGVGPPMRQGQ